MHIKASTQNFAAYRLCQPPRLERSGSLVYIAWFPGSGGLFLHRVIFCFTNTKGSLTLLISTQSMTYIQCKWKINQGICSDWPVLSRKTDQSWRISWLMTTLNVQMYVLLYFIYYVFILSSHLTLVAVHIYIELPPDFSCSTYLYWAPTWL